MPEGSQVGGRRVATGGSAVAPRRPISALTPSQTPPDTFLHPLSPCEAGLAAVEAEAGGQEVLEALEAGQGGAGGRHEVEPGSIWHIIVL